MQQIPIDLTQTENNRLTVIADVERKKNIVKKTLENLIHSDRHMYDYFENKISISQLLRLMK